MVVSIQVSLSKVVSLPLRPPQPVRDSIRRRSFGSLQSQHSSGGLGSIDEVKIVGLTH